MKKWYSSKTIWVNVLALAALILQTQIGFIIDPEEQAGIIVVINLILRIFTGEGLEA